MFATASELTIQLGKAMLQVMDSTYDPYKVGIDPDALQMWPAPDKENWLSLVGARSQAIQFRLPSLGA